MTTMRDALARAMGRCWIMADHAHPNEKDQEQARAMIAALQKQAG